MTIYIVRRLIATIPVLFLISAITFFTIRLLPGDPALAILGPEADFNLVEALREELGLNRPVIVQYLDWMYHAFQGEFGESRRSGDTVAALVSDRLEVTIQLGILSLIVAVILALPIGLLAGSKPNTPFDYLGTFFAVVGAAIPNFWLALLLILVFAVDLGWFPALGFTSFREDPLENMRGMVLPAIAIGIAQAAVLARQTRASMVEVLQQGLRAHGAQQGPARTKRDLPPRLPQRDDSRDHDPRPADFQHRQRGDHHRIGLLAAGHRQAADRLDLQSRAGHGAGVGVDAGARRRDVKPAG